MESLYSWILSECSLGAYLKSVYDDLLTKGFVNSKLNRWITISYCISHKVHNSKVKMLQLSSDDFQKSFDYIMPYHALLLLWEIKDILPMLPIDGSPHLSRFLEYYSPLKTLESISLAIDMSLMQIFLMSSHLIHWGMAIIIYPICLGNAYVLAPSADISADSPLVHEFETKFKGQCLLQKLSEFSTTLTLGSRFSKYTQSSNHQEFLQMIAWMLRNRMIQQLHTYPQYIPIHKSKLKPVDEESLSKVHALLCKMRLEARVSDIDIISRTVASEMSAADSDAEFRGSSFDDIGDGMDWYSEGNYTCNSDDGYEDMISQDSSDAESEPPERDPVVEQLLTEFTEEEREELVSIPSFSKLRYFEIFVRLLKRGLLTGERHVEHIMYVGNVSRSRLMQLFEKFSPVFVTSEKPDEAVAMFYPRVDELGKNGESGQPA